MDAFGDQFGTSPALDKEIVFVVLYPFLPPEVEDFAGKSGSEGLLCNAGDHRHGFPEEPPAFIENGFLTSGERLIG